MAWLPKSIVLVPTDFSGPSIEALPVAREMVALPSGIEVVHAVNVATDYDPNIFAGEEHHQDHREAARERLRELLEQHQLPEAKATVLDDDGEGSGKALARYAGRINAELIVMPTHGYSGLKRMLMGSVAEQVARHAPCPVLLLRWPQE